MSILKQFIQLMRETIKEWSEDGAAGIAASLAYYTIFSLSPLLIIIALFLGLVMDRSTIQTSVVDGLRGAVGDSGAQIIGDLIQDPQTTSTDVIGTMIWLAFIVWGASGLFSQLQTALNKIWEVKHAPGRSPTALVGARVLSFMTLMMVGIALLVTLFINTLLSRYLLMTDTLPLEWVIRPIQFLISMVATTVLIGAVFKILPDVIIRWRDVLPGAAFTALLFYIGQFILGQYLSRSNVGSVFGTAGSLTALLVWIYYSAQILLFGAEFTEVWARHYGAAIRPDADAMWISESQARREAKKAKAGFSEDDSEILKMAHMEEEKERRNERIREVVARVRPSKNDGAEDDDDGGADQPTAPPP